MGFFKKNIMFSVLIAVSLVVGMHQVAKAEVSNDVVYDKHGGIVHDSFGGCIRTMWFVDSDPCGTKMDPIVQIMKMKERIIYFNFDKYDLKESEMKKLDMLAKVFIKHNVKSAKIVGYTDRLGSHNYNLKLSEKRAEAVKDYLSSKVMLDKTPVEMRGLGEMDQVKSCSGIKGDNLIKCLAPNRRVEVEVDYYDIVR